MSISRIRQKVWANPGLNIHELIGKFFCQEVILTTIEAYIEESDILYLHKTIYQLREILKPKIGLCIGDFTYNTPKKLKECIEKIAESDSALASIAKEILSSPEESLIDAIVNTKGGVKLSALIMYEQLENT